LRSDARASDCQAILTMMATKDATLQVPMVAPMK
jgi:hypothetical protein